ncbi:hypothetical protein IAR50_007434 [Cryptococcus sp. DSM 104548]
MGTFIRPEPAYVLGPFKVQKEHYLGHIDQTLAHIWDFPFVQLDGVLSYLWMLELREMVECCGVLGREEEEFYIRHGDDQPRQYLRDDERHITGVLDWEWTCVTTKSEAFSSPLGLHALDLQGSWEEGSNHLHAEELIMVEAFEKLGRPDLGDCIRHGRLYLRLRDALRPDDNMFYFQRHNVNGLLDAFRETGREFEGPFLTDEVFETYVDGLYVKHRTNEKWCHMGVRWDGFVERQAAADKVNSEIVDDVIERELLKVT